MALFAIINENVVTEIKELSEAEFPEESRKCQLIIDVSDMSISPGVGWVLVGSTLSPTEPLSAEARAEKIAQAKIKFGFERVSSALAKLGARNAILNKTVEEITAVLTNLLPIKTLLEVGALETAVGAMMQAKALYPEYEDIFDECINNTMAFLASLEA